MSGCQLCNESMKVIIILQRSDDGIPLITILR